MLPSLRERRARRAQARFFATFCVAFIVLFVSWALFFHLSTVLPNTAPSGGSGSAGWGSWSQELWWAAHLLVCLWLFQGGTASYLSVRASSLACPAQPPPTLAADLFVVAWLCGAAGGRGCQAATRPPPAPTATAGATSSLGPALLQVVSLLCAFLRSPKLLLLLTANPYAGQQPKLGRTHHCKSCDRCPAPCVALCVHGWCARG